MSKLCYARTVISPSITNVCLLNGDHRTFLTSPDQVFNCDCASPQLVEAGRAISSRCTSEDVSSLSNDHTDASRLAGEPIRNRRDFCYMEYGQKPNPNSTSRGRLEQWLVSWTMDQGVTFTLCLLVKPRKQWT